MCFLIVAMVYIVSMGSSNGTLILCKKYCNKRDSFSSNNFINVTVIDNQ